MIADINDTILLINADNACRTAIDFGPARNVRLERVPHPWKQIQVMQERVARFPDLPDWYVLLDSGLGRPVTFWETDKRVVVR